MTVICVKGLEMAADRRVSYGDLRVGSAPKLVRGEGFVAGAAGTLSLCQPWLRWARALPRGAIREFLDRPEAMATAALPPECDEETTALVLLDGGEVWRVERGRRAFQVAAEFHAIGSGCEIALGAMAAGADARRAAEIACTFDGASGIPVDSCSVAAEAGR